MRKVLALAASLVFAGAMAVSAIAYSDPADDPTNNNDQPDIYQIVPGLEGADDDNPLAATRNTAVTYDQDPDYLVTIPAGVALSSENETEFTIQASKVNLFDKTGIIVTIDKETDFKVYLGGDTSKSAIDYTIRQDGKTDSIAAGGLAAAFTEDGAQKLYFSKIDDTTAPKAGSYSGTLTFDIAVETLTSQTAG